MNYLEAFSSSVHKVKNLGENHYNDMVPFIVNKINSTIDEKGCVTPSDLREVLTKAFLLSEDEALALAYHWLSNCPGIRQGDGSEKNAKVIDFYSKFNHRKDNH